MIVQLIYNIALLIALVALLVIWSMTVDILKNISSKQDALKERISRLENE